MYQCITLETITALLIGYIPIQNKKFKKPTRIKNYIENITAWRKSEMQNFARGVIGHLFYSSLKSDISFPPFPLFSPIIRQRKKY